MFITNFIAFQIEEVYDGRINELFDASQDRSAMIAMEPHPDLLTKLYHYQVRFYNEHFFL